MKQNSLLPLLLLSFLLLSSCVSKKKHLEAMAVYGQRVDSLHYLLDTSYNRIYQLELDIAHRQGANEALLATQDKMQDRIIGLDDEIERLQHEAANREESLDSRLQQKDATIAAKQAKIDALANTLGQRQKDMSQLARLLRDTLSSMDSTAYSINIADGQISVSLSSNFLFYPGSTSKTHSAGRQALEKISRVLSAYPALDVLVIGHTDNTAPRRNSISDNWEFSVLRAATAVQLMARKYELSANRITAAGKGEFAPRASNATAEGRALNERIEIRIFPSQERLIRDLRRELD